MWEIMIVPKKIVFGLFLLICALHVTAMGCQARQEFIFGVHPYKKPYELVRMFTPLIKYLGEETGAGITFRTAENYSDAMEKIASGEMDIFYLGPAPFLVLAEQYPDRFRIAATVVNKGKPMYKGVIVVRDTSAITTMADFKGKKFAFGDRHSTFSCYMPATMLLKAEVFDSVDYSFLGSHDNVAKAVIRGFFDGGGIKYSVAKKYEGKGLKIIAESEPLHEHLIGVGPDVDDATFKKIKKALLKVQDEKIYQSIKASLTGFTTAKMTDYENLRGIIKEVDARINK